MLRSTRAQRSLSRMWVVVLPALGLGCASVSVKPSVYQKHTFGLAAFYGPTRIDTSAIGIAGAFQAGNDWGVKVAEGSLDGVRGQIEQALGVQLLPDEQMIAAPGYASAVPVPAAEQYASPRGMRPLSADPSNDPLLGNVATGIGVEAIIVISNNWAIRREAGTAQQYGFDLMRIAIVGADGTRLWDQTENAEGRVASGSTGISMAGATTPEQAQAMAKAAVLQGVDRFVTAWAANKKP